MEQCKNLAVSFLTQLAVYDMKYILGIVQPVLAFGVDIGSQALLDIKTYGRYC